MKKSELEIAFAKSLERFGKDLPTPVAEVRLVPGRRFRWDFVFMAERVAVEIQGGTWMPKSGHKGKGALRDMDKANLAAIYGYRTLFFCGNHLSTHAKCIETVDVMRRTLCPGDEKPGSANYEICRESSAKGGRGDD